MIGTSGATVLFIVNIVLASVLGIGIGGLMCLILRRYWTLRSAITDAVLAAAIAIIAAYVVTAVESSRGVWESRVTVVMTIAACGIALRHLVVSLLRSYSHQSPWR